MNETQLTSSAVALMFEFDMQVALRVVIIFALALTFYHGFFGRRD